MKFYVDFILPISTCRVIKADTKEEAEAIAEEMVREDDDYWTSIIDSMETDYENFREKYCKFEAMGNAPSNAVADNE